MKICINIVFYVPHKDLKKKMADKNIACYII